MSSERRYDKPQQRPAEEVELTWTAALVVLVLAALAGTGIGWVAWTLSRRARRS